MINFRHRIYKVNNKTNELPKLTHFNRLSLDDLLKIKAMHAKYLVKKAIIDEERKKLALSNDIYNKNVEIYKANVQDVEKQIKLNTENLYSICRQLAQYERGIIAGVFNIGNVIRVSANPNHTYQVKKTSESEKLVAQHRKIEETLCLLNEKKSLYKYPNLPYEIKPKSFWKTSTTMTINGVRVEVDFDFLNKLELDEMIELHQSKIAKQRESIRELKARAASNAIETRQLAQAERRKLKLQLSVLKCCPYCGDPLSPNDAHLDHIYPVSKGGQSRKTNLVFVCSTCNRQKSNLTLQAFIDIKVLNVATIHKRLRLLLKEF